MSARRVFVPLNAESSLVDVSDGAIIKGPGSYYVPADIADETLAALREAYSFIGGVACNPAIGRVIRAAIAKTENAE